MEIYGGGSTFLSGLDNVEAIRARLCSITQKEVTDFIKSQFATNRGVRHVLEALLKVFYVRWSILGGMVIFMLLPCRKCRSTSLLTVSKRLI